MTPLELADATLSYPTSNHDTMLHILRGRRGRQLNLKSDGKEMLLLRGDEMRIMILKIFKHEFMKLLCFFDQFIRFFP